ncbi:hypothetical protein LTR53_000433 [Teratosphaeriaceae sp. CCFEE 6253]|nr:hypothetical protein LTR53_000433 [Teratosphaeriaceae sp. CCFEE 6253]
MTSFPRIPLLLLYLHTALAAQPSAPPPIPAPLRRLPWSPSGLNILHTTDTHGWHAGHLQEAPYAADWGDYLSFTHHLRLRADADGADLLVVDTGDRVEGNGLYDASVPKGKYTFSIFERQQFDVVTPGNHELYLAETAAREFDEVVPDLGAAYVASNLDYRDPETGAWRDFAPRFRVFTTPNRGVRVLAFGFLFDFKGNANNTLVQPVEETVKESWFQDALRTKDVDLFLVAGHVPVRDSKEYDAVYRAIRAVQWDTPIVFLGGHTHVRDFRRYGKKAVGLESGRYMETVGFLSVSGLSSNSSRIHDQNTPAPGPVDDAATASVDFRRLYIDNNLLSYRHHTSTNSSSFPTPLGLNTSRAITLAREALKLDRTFGCVPQTYWLNRAPYPSNDSLLSLLDQRILPETFAKDIEVGIEAEGRTRRPTMVITNTGAMRFDLFKGRFTVDSAFLVSPFGSGFRVVRGVRAAVADRVLEVLNQAGQIAWGADEVGSADDSRELPRVRDLLPTLPPFNQRTLRGGDSAVMGSDGGEQQQIPLVSTAEHDDDDEREGPTLPGYTTYDDFGSDGDDTVHQRIQFYDVPNCVASYLHFPAPTGDEAGHGGGGEEDTVEIIYNEFIQAWVLLALRYLGQEFAANETAVAVAGRTMTDVLRGWVEENWPCDAQGE